MLFSPAWWRWPLHRPAPRPSWVHRWALPWACLRRKRWQCLRRWAWAWPCPYCAGRAGCRRCCAGCRAPARGWTPSAAPWRSRCLPPSSGWCGCWASKAALTAPPPCWRCCCAWAALAWALTLRGKTRAVLGVLVLALAAWLAQQLWPQCGGAAACGQCQPTAQPPAQAGNRGLPSAQAELLAQGRPVFVDYTAAWCVTCQYNKRTTLAEADVLAAFAAAQRGLAACRLDAARPRHHRRADQAGPQWRARVRAAGARPSAAGAQLNLL